jgi:2-dehydro-3-deoxyphosphogluconate aldolase/(4S)-4-hydroxy-2-oxoglutarate aldolase
MNTLEQKQLRLESILQLAPVVAVVVVDDVRAAVALARALVAGGIKAIEVTLRTAAALEAIRAIAGEVEGAEVGAGTVLTPADLISAENAGASFAVSPGATSALLAAARDSALPYLPGAATPSESLRLFELGYRLQKFFPAESAGGVNYLRSLAGPLPQIRFCPTGGISVGNAGTYLNLPNVICVGGSWLASADIMRAQDWATVESLARAAAHLRRA